MTRMKRRDSIAILADILSIIASHGPLRKTRLMNYANLNPRTFNMYVSRLESVGLIRLVDGNTYQLTGRGAAFLSMYNSLMRTFNRPAGSRPNMLERLASMVTSRDGLRLGYMVSSRSGVKHYYDMLIVRESQPAIAIYDTTSSHAGVSSFEAGIMLLSCIENPSIHHIVVAEGGVAEYYQNMLAALRAAGLCSAAIVQPPSPERVMEAIEEILSTL